VGLAPSARPWQGLRCAAPALPSPPAPPGSPTLATRGLPTASMTSAGLRDKLVLTELGCAALASPVARLIPQERGPANQPAQQQQPLLGVSVSQAPCARPWQVLRCADPALPLPPASPGSPTLATWGPPIANTTNVWGLVRPVITEWESAAQAWIVDPPLVLLSL